MALTPEDVIKKSFSATHLRRGYDETQVDDFLDEVVVELRRLIAENDSLRSDLADCRASKGLPDDAPGSRTDLEFPGELEAELERVKAELEHERQRNATSSAPLAATLAEDTPSRAEVEDLRRRLVEGEQVDAQLEELRHQLAESEQARARAENAVAEAEARLLDRQGGAGGGQLVEQSDVGQPKESSAIIALAQRLHDQHVAEGESTRARLLQEGNEYHERVVGEADARAHELVSTAQEAHDRLVQEGQSTHDELVSAGRQEHDRLVQDGQARHDELVSTGQARHDELIAAGQARHDELVTTGQRAHDHLVGEAQQSREQTLTEAEQRRSAILSDLSSQQQALTEQIAELHTQESDLRDRLRAFLSDQLSKLDTSRS